MTKWQKIPQDVACQILRGVLHQFVGHGRAMSKSRFFTLMGCRSERTIDNWMNGVTAPAHHEFMQMCAVLGPEFINAWLAHMSMSGARDITPSEQCARRMNCKVAQATALLAEALADGYLDHQERAALQPVMRELQQMVEQFLAAPQLALVSSSPTGAVSHVSA